MEIIEIPFGAKDSELQEWEYTIPKGMEAEIKDGKVIIKRKKSENERIIEQIKFAVMQMPSDREDTKKECLAWLEKQKINTEGDFGRGYDCGYKACLNSHGAEFFEKQKEQKDFQTKVEQRMEYLWDKLPDAHKVEEGNCTPEEWKTLGAYMELEMNFDKDSEEQKEQKPAEYLSKEKVFAIMNKLTSLSFCVPLGSDEEKKIHEITCDVSSLLDYPIEKQKPAEFDEYKIIKKHITEDMLSSEVNKRLTECGWYVTDEKPVEWSEENEKDTAHIIRILDDCYAYGKHDLSKTDHENLVNKLKSLRPQPHWKPSEKQMDFLKDIINEYKYLARPKVVAILQSLYNNLKEL